MPLGGAIPPLTVHETVNYILAGMNIVSMGIVGWFTYVIRGFTKDVLALQDQDREIMGSVQAAILERNHKLERMEGAFAEILKERDKRIDKIELSVEDNGKASLGIQAELHRCQLEHTQRLQRAELRSEDLKKIDGKLEKLFELVSLSHDHISQVSERVTRIETTVDVIRKNGHGSKL